MNRRAVLAGAGLALPLSSGGCLDEPSGDAPGSRDPGRPTELIDAVLTTGIDESSGADEPPGPDDPPRIAFDGTAATVTVEGSMRYSSSSCGGIGLDHAGYDETDAEASVRVVSEIDEAEGTVCTDDITVGSYRVEPTFDAGVPASVEAVENGEFGEIVATAPWTDLLRSQRQRITPRVWST